MKRPKRRPQKPVTEERILQLSNDQSENINSGTLREWKAVAVYFSREHDRLWNDVGALRCSIAALTAAWKMHAYAFEEMAKWLDKQTPTSME